MNKYFCILLSIILLSCNQTQLEKDYVKNLEEKNKILEQELKEIKGESKSSNTQRIKRKSEISTDYFTIGSTEDEVIKVMGEPSSYMVTAPEARRFYYGMSSVYFYQGKVISYDNLEDNLKARVRR
jgi:hypothetical protein